MKGEGGRERKGRGWKKVNRLKIEDGRRCDARGTEDWIERALEPVLILDNIRRYERSD